MHCAFLIINTKKNKMKKLILINVIISLFFISCKKESQIISSSDKSINTFVIKVPAPQLYEYGEIIGDTIFVKIEPGISLVNLIPIIEFSGASINPDSQVPMNFTNPVTFTVTAQDGSTKSYVVLVSSKSTTKEIISFKFRNSENPSLASDALGRILNDSIILVNVPGSADLHHLKPTIIHNGVSINPSINTAIDFSDFVYYTVSAEDSSTKKYKVWVSSNKTVFISSANGYIYALDASTGETKWNFNGGGQMGSPIYSEGKVYVAAQGGALYCLNAETGSFLWSFNNQVTNYTTPCINNGILFIGYNRSGGAGINAIDANIGTLLWTKNIAFIYPNVGNPTAADGFVVIPEINFGINVFNAITGEAVWSISPGIVRGNPLVKDGVVYLGSETNLLTAYNLNNGSIIWQNNSTYSISGSPVILGNIVYTSADRKMYAFNKSNGTIVWSEQSWGGYNHQTNQTGRPIGFFSSAAISVSDTAIFAGCDDGRTYCLNLTPGAKKWAYMPNPISMASTPNPVAGNGMVVTNREDNSLYSFSARSGTLIWKFTASASINSDPCMIDNDGNVFYPGNSGNNN